MTAWHDSQSLCQPRNHSGRASSEISREGFSTQRSAERGSGAGC